jgi:hypothetical protein
MSIYECLVSVWQYGRTLCALPRPSLPLSYAVHLPPQTPTPVHTHAPNPPTSLHLPSFPDLDIGRDAAE